MDQLDKDNRGSRPRCVLLMDGNPDDVAKRLTQLVGFPDVVVDPNDKWMPNGKASVKEAKLGEPNDFVPHHIQQQLQTWWLAVPKRANTPNWDITSPCRIKGKQGLLLIEAKAHENELSRSGKSPPTSSNSQRNHQQIGRATEEAKLKLEQLTGKCWDLSRDRHYQLSNRFAWAWKLVSLGIPVVLVYLGFLNAQDMGKNGPIFPSELDWERTLKKHCAGVIDDTIWEQQWDFAGVPLLPLIRAFDQPFQP